MELAKANMRSAQLSHRTENTLLSIDRPWRFAPRATYDPETNPEGLISFGLAENVKLMAP